MKLVFKYLKKYWLATLLAPLFMMLEVVMDLAQPTLIANLVDVGIKNGDLNYIIKTGLTMLGYAIIGMIGGVLCSVFASNAAIKASTDLRKDLYKKVQSLSYGNIDKLETGSIITRLTNDVMQIQQIMLMGMRIMIRAPFLAIGSIIMGLIISPKLSFVFAVIVPIISLAIFIVLRKGYPLFSKVQDNLDHVNRVVQENLSGIRVVKAFVKEKHECKKFGEANTQLTTTSIKASRTMAIMMPILTLGVNLGIVAILYIGGFLTINNTLQVGLIIAFVNYLQRLLMALMMVGMILLRVSRAKASSVRINDLLNEQVEIKNLPNCINEFTPEGTIEFKNVTFSYSGSCGDAVLKDISFSVNHGETLAILGATGSGKSSLVNLVPRFYDVTLGEILIDGINVKNIDKKALRQMIGFSHQQTVLFSGSVAYNVQFGASTMNTNEMKEVCDIANATEFIEGLPEGFMSSLNQRGVNLSGGQKQRLSIARALAKEPAILILDDSTSAVDITTEARIQNELKRSMKSTTCIIVAQRISSVLDADQIIILDDGKIVAKGSHKELISTSAIYQDIYTSQLGEEGLNHAPA